MTFGVYIRNQLMFDLKKERKIFGELCMENLRRLKSYLRDVLHPESVR